MEPMDKLLTGATEYQGKKNNRVTGQVFAKPGEIYAVYVPVGENAGTLDPTAAGGKFVQRWYNPHTGEFAPSAKVIEGGRPLVLGRPPKEVSQDWAVLIARPSKQA